MKKVLAVFLLASSFLFSKEYHIGDKISLKINKNLDEKELENSFKNFKIINKKKTKDGGTIITFISLKPGENSLKLGNKEIIIPIKSTITKNDNKIYEELANKKNRYDYQFFTTKNTILLTTGVLSVLLGCFFWYEDRRKNAYLNFIKSMKNVNINNWREDISYYLRKYVDKRFNSNFLGGEYIANDLIDEKDIEFFKELDRLKFSPNSSEKYEEIKDKAFKLAKKIEGGMKNVRV